MFLLHVCVRVLVPLELELKVVVSCHVDAGHQTKVLSKNTQGSYLLSHPSSPRAVFKGPQTAC